MFPYHDENATQRTAIVTIAIIVLCMAAWVLGQGAGSEIPLATAVCNLGLIPGELTGLARPGDGFPMGSGLFCATDPGPAPSHIFTSMFLHGSWMHLLGNMWFLWLFGNNVEDSMTRGRYVVFYLLCGVVAAAMQVLSEPDSIVPMVGASGAISGVMGAYLILFPHVRVYTFVPPFFSLPLPAWVMLLYWMGLQLMGGFSSPDAEGGVAFWAHVGGFVAGLLTIRLFARRDRVVAHVSHNWRPRREGFRVR